MIDSRLTRRRFVRLAGAAAAGALGAPAIDAEATRRLDKPVKIGLIADLHHDIIHNAAERLDAFLAAMSEAEPDAIIQLGDFAYPNKKNQSLADRFNKAHGVALHVIGNHDLDGHNAGQCVEAWGMAGRYYTRDVGGLRLIVLDGNDRGSPTHAGGYPRYIGDEQREWLGAQIDAHDGPIVVLSHQPLAGYVAVDNAEAMQTLLGKHAGKVVLAINGHTHIDDLLEVGGVRYLHVNSASYKWVGGAHAHDSYPPEVMAAHPSIRKTCPYRDPLFAMLTFEAATKFPTIAMTGRESRWVGPSPKDLGVKLDPALKYDQQVTPRIRSRRIPAESRPQGG